MLDMDGTLLDLYFDNLLWNEMIPQLYAQTQSISVEDAREELFADMKAIRHTLKFYCLEHWTERTQLDVLALHRQITHLIQYRHRAEAFLQRLVASKRRVLLVTNAHPDAICVKDQFAHLSAKLHGIYSSHQFDAPKESQRFWQALSTAEPFEPAATLFIDDTIAVLESAETYGIEHLLTVAQPDSQRPPRRGLKYPSFNSFSEIMPPE